MNHYLRESERTNINSIYFCNYCGNKAIEHTSYSDHGYTCDVYYMCSCEGVELANELKGVVSDVKQSLDIAEEKLNIHMNQVHPSIKQRLFEQEVSGLRIKYGVYGDE